ncbi:MAG: N-6 DNA methylase [bacterium]
MVNEVTRERAQSFLTDAHIERIVAAYRKFKDEPGFTRVATLEEIRQREGNLSIPLYVTPSVPAVREEHVGCGADALTQALEGWIDSSFRVRAAIRALLGEEWVDNES